MGAVSFIETMDHTSLSSITQEEFEANVETAIQNLPPSPIVTPATPSAGPDFLPEPPKTPSAAPAPGEESASALQMPTPASVAEDTRKFLQRTGTLAQQTISKPLNAIGKILSDALDGIEEDGGRKKPESSQWNHPERIQQYAQDPRTPQGGGVPIPIMQAPYKARIRPGSATPSPSQTPTAGGIAGGGPPALPPRGGDYFTPYSGAATSLNRAVGRGSSTPSPDMQPRNLEAEIGAIESAHRQAARETVHQIFPTVENEVIDMVLEANGGDLGRTIDALLEMSAST
jgi:Rab5 GDP/GTP exchange factor